MVRVRPASATFEAIEAEVLPKVWAKRVAGGGVEGERSELTAVGLASSCRRRVSNKITHRIAIYIYNLDLVCPDSGCL